MFLRCILVISLFLLASSAPIGKKRNSTKVKHPSNNASRPKNYESLGGGFEGDMLFPEGFNPKLASEDKGVAAAGPGAWPDNTIPYDLSAISSWFHRSFIEQAMQTLMNSVGGANCLSFRRRTTADQYYVRIVYGAGCSGTVGFWPGTDMLVTLNDPGCFYSGIIQHELLHVLGFYHEQSRPDRDTYVKVYYDNIQQGMEYNFDRYSWGREVLDQHSPYDYQSIMHYDAYSFSRNGQATILPYQSGVTIGQRQGLSQIDIEEVRAYYQC